jgi:hypothetical protein
LQYSVPYENENHIRSRTSAKSWLRRSNDVSLNRNSMRGISWFDEKIARIQLDRLEEHSLQQQKN